MLISKDHDTENPQEIQPMIFQLTYPYSDRDNICSIIDQPARDNDTNYTYTALHLNIHSLPAKNDNMKLMLTIIIIIIMPNPLL